MAKFTSGPWMSKKHDGAGRTFELKREFWEVGGGPDKAGVAFVFKGQANANLIAAAPEMYAYLEKMRDGMNCICKFNGMLGLEVDCTKCAIDKLLAKADGTENGE